ncbi:hypothetical protein HanRHA438_Chr01g0014691 [Helianthus annuus]|nr:hypothetical protein HanRHA438_Chr01g0014691 [Helianthus annuus]
MALTTRNSVISAQLSAIVARLDAIFAAMKDDIAAIKTQMIRDGSYCEKSDEDWNNTVAENSLMANKRDEIFNSNNRKGHHQILEIKVDKPYLPTIPKPLQPTPKIPPRISDFDKHMRFLTCNCWSREEGKGIPTVNNHLLLKGTHMIRRKSLKSNVLSNGHLGGVQMQKTRKLQGLHNPF